MRLLLATIFASLAVTSAAADPKPPADVGQMVTDDCAKARRVNKQCVLTIESHEIEGGKPVGQGMVVTVPSRPVQSSLIRIRRDFIQEILKTAEDL